MWLWHAEYHFLSRDADFTKVRLQDTWQYIWCEQALSINTLHGSAVI